MLAEGKLYRTSGRGDFSLSSLTVIMPDNLHPLLHATCGAHDERPKPHWHFAILTIDKGVVVDVDWGYHSVKEALKYAKKSTEHRVET